MQGQSHLLGACATSATCTVLVPDGQLSPFGGAPWDDVFGLMAQRFAWEDGDLRLSVFTEPSAPEFERQCASCDVLVVAAADDAAAVARVAAMPRPVTLVLDCSPV